MTPKVGQVWNTIPEEWAVADNKIATATIVDVTDNVVCFRMSNCNSVISWTIPYFKTAFRLSESTLIESILSHYET